MSVKTLLTRTFCLPIWTSWQHSRELLLSNSRISAWVYEYGQNHFSPQENITGTIMFSWSWNACNRSEKRIRCFILLTAFRKERKEMGLCGRCHKPNTRARKTETKMRQAVKKEKKLTTTKSTTYLWEETIMQRHSKIKVLNWFTILLEMAIANLLHYRTR